MLLTSNLGVYITPSENEDRQQNSDLKFASVFGSETTIAAWTVISSPTDEEEESDFKAAMEARNKPGALPWGEVKKNLGL